MYIFKLSVRPSVILCIVYGLMFLFQLSRLRV